MTSLALEAFVAQATERSRAQSEPADCVRAIAPLMLDLIEDANSFLSEDGRRALEDSKAFVRKLSQSDEVQAVFRADPALIQRLEHGDWLNAPWGVAIAPLDFGVFSHDLLIGQFAGGGTSSGSGTIAAYDLAIPIKLQVALS